jgi:photosystem II stability/assembly factor-like uncharacterized protein
MRNEFRAERQRHEVAVQRFASPQRDAAPHALEEFWENRHMYDRAENATWKDKGPCNFSGRATCLVVDPRQPNLLYAGSAGGGLWKSEDGGESWNSCWPNSLSQNIGAVAIDPENCAHIICATGEGNFSNASYPGSGIYLSDDCGVTWRSFIFVPLQRRIKAADRERMPRRVSCIAFSPKDPELGRTRIAFGSISNDEQLIGGLYLDTGSSGLRFVDKWSSRPYDCYSAVFHPTEPKVLYASIEAGGAVNGIWRSTDGGTKWKHLTDGLPKGELCGRISLAISRKNPSILYALVSSRRRKVLGVFVSDTGGNSWINTAGSEFDSQGQLAFNNTIAIHPDDPRIVVCGAQALFLTTDGGRHWQQISERTRAVTSTIMNSRYVHSDHHAIVMPGNDVIYSANDGGIAKSTDLGKTWSEASKGMSTVMFYAIDVSPANARIYGGGTQDNGTMMAGVNAGFGLRRGRRDAHEFTQVLEGDGGYLVCDADEEELVFASSFETETRCHEPGRRWASGLRMTKWRNASPRVPEAEKNVLGLTVMAIKPAVENGRRELLLGTNRLWRTRNNGRSWRPSRFQFDGSAITAIEIANADPSVMFIGTARGGIYRSDDGGRVWSADLAGPEIPNRVITQIETHPIDPRIVVVTVASTGRATAALGGAAKTYSHVFRSKDSGRHWKDIDQGKLPNVVFNGLAFETHPPYRIFVAGDAGPWVLQANGEWASIAGNMPSTVISDIIYHHKTRTLTAGTYGRGIWRMHVPRRFRIARVEQGLDTDALLPPIEGYFLDRSVPVPEPVTPAEGTTFDFFPRKIELACSRVKGAIGYAFETMTGNRMFQVKSSPMPFAEIEMRGGGNYAWTCWALLPGGRCSFPSRGTKFRFLV